MARVQLNQYNPPARSEPAAAEQDYYIPDENALRMKKTTRGPFSFFAPRMPAQIPVYPELYEKEIERRNSYNQPPADQRYKDQRYAEQNDVKHNEQPYFGGFLGALLGLNKKPAAPAPQTINQRPAPVQRLVSMSQRPGHGSTTNDGAFFGGLTAPKKDG